MVSSMPSKTLRQRRDRAIIATSFLLATRANATASLLLKHIDVKNRCAYQIATESRIKNSKIQTAHFFPGPTIFEDILAEWVVEMRERGAVDSDALFPPDRDLDRVSRWVVPGRQPIEP